MHGGTTLILIHTYVAVPAPTAVIATAKLTSIHRGHYGTHVVAQIPSIADGTTLAITHVLPCSPE